VNDCRRPQKSSRGGSDLSSRNTEIRGNRFGHLGGEGGDPDGLFAELIEDEYPGGVEMWQQAVRKAASAARGWVMVGYDLNDG